MKQLSKIASGIPLRQTNPASVEKFLIEKVREDLGNFKDLAVITPVVRVDSEDGDLSGNISNGFGNIMLDVRGTKVHIPFIIHDKELLPFDEIRLGDQAVAYDASKLRRIVNGIDKKEREAGDRDEGEGKGRDFSIGSIADPKHVRSGNGFLGTIMQVRDDEVNRGSNGALPWQGMDFGSMDDARMDRAASAEMDVLDVFNDAVEKLAAVKVIPKAAVEHFAAEFEKRAADESQKMIDSVSAVKQDSLEAAGVRRGMAKMDQDKLADIGRVASGNDIRFPVSEVGHFEYRNGRVYHNVRPWAVNDKKRIVTPIKSLVVDSQNHYKFLHSGDKFMVTTDAPIAFKFRTEQARGLVPNSMYAMEIDTSTVSYPFVVRNRRHLDNDGLPYNMPVRFTISTEQRATNTLFLDNIGCVEAVPAKGEEEWSQAREFAIIVSRKEDFQEVRHMDQMELQQYVAENAEDPEDARLAMWLVDSYGTKDFYLVGQQHPFLRLEKALQGHFTRQDGYFSEGPIVKQAAYDNLNKATLKVEKDGKPRSYTLAWQYSDEVKGGEVSGSVQLQKRQLNGLTEDKVRQLLMNLGYDNRRIELFFEITRRNGREATFDLPDVEKAKNLSPGDIAAQKAKSAVGNIAKNTLNPQNFMPVLTDVMGEGLAGLISNAAPQTADWARSLNGWMKTSFDTALELEKVASETGGDHWYELAALVNLKHRLDKQAAEIASGNYLTGLDVVLEKVAGLQPAIAKHAHNLIGFNRQQLLSYDKPPVSPKLIKQALNELDGLSRYASAHPIVEDQKEEKAPSVGRAAAIGAGLGGLAYGAWGAKKGLRGMQLPVRGPEGEVVTEYIGGEPILGLAGGLAAGTFGAVHGGLAGAAVGGIHKAIHNHKANKEAGESLFDRLDKTADEADGPHRLPIPLLGEDLVGRSGSVLSAIIPDSMRSEADGLIGRLESTVAGVLPGKN